MSDTKSSWLFPESEWRQRIFERVTDAARQRLAEQKAAKRYVPVASRPQTPIGPPPTVPAGYRDDSREDYYVALACIPCHQQIEVLPAEEMFSRVTNLVERRNGTIEQNK